MPFVRGYYAFPEAAAHMPTAQRDHLCLRGLGVSPFATSLLGSARLTKWTTENQDFA